jgi:hypothetical protein
VTRLSGGSGRTRLRNRGWCDWRTCSLVRVGVGDDRHVDPSHARRNAKDLRKECRTYGPVAVIWSADRHLSSGTASGSAPLAGITIAPVRRFFSRLGVGWSHRNDQAPQGSSGRPEDRKYARSAAPDEPGEDIRRSVTIGIRPARRFSFSPETRIRSSGPVRCVLESGSADAMRSGSTWPADAEES